MLFKNNQKCNLFHVKSPFCPDFLVIYKKGLIRKLWSISKFMASQTGQEIITMHILPNILRSKGNQIMKFGQLIEYNMTSIFLEKSYKQCDGETIFGTFYKKIKIECTSGRLLSKYFSLQSFFTKDSVSLPLT